MKMEEFPAKWNPNQVLETNLSERSLWLMKCPSLVVNSFNSVPFPDDPYRPQAVVTLSVDPLAKEDEETQFVMELGRAESRNIPKRYTLDMSKDFIPMNVYCQSSEGKLSTEGKIKNKFDMRPHKENMESYGKLCRERASKYMCKNRQIQVIDNANGMHMRPMPEMKRTRRDRREMEEIMFNLFERQSNWTLRNLIQETDQPEQFVKDLLKDLCIYNNKGSNQGTYELKPEYKKATQDD